METTFNTLSEVVAAINAKFEFSAEQYQAIKAAFLPAIATKLISGEVTTVEERTFLNFVTKTVNIADGKAKREADIAAKQAEAKAKYKQEMQAYGIELTKSVFDFFKTGLPKGTKFEKVAELKTMFSDFIKTLPAEPKLEGVKAPKGEKSSNASAKPWNSVVNVNKLKDGSSFKCLWDFVCANNGVTKKQMEDELTAKFPTKTANKTAIYDATSGRLPLRKEVVEGVIYYFAVAPAEPELEIVATATN